MSKLSYSSRPPASKPQLQLILIGLKNQSQITPGLSVYWYFYQSQPNVQISYALTFAGACMIEFWSGKIWTENSSLLWTFQLHQLKIDPLVHKHGCGISIVLAWGLQSGAGPLGISSHGWFQSRLPACPCRGWVKTEIKRHKKNSESRYLDLRLLKPAQEQWSRSIRSIF